MTVQAEYSSFNFNVSSNLKVKAAMEQVVKLACEEIGQQLKEAQRKLREARENLSRA